MCLYPKEIRNPATIPSLKKGREKPGKILRDQRHNTIKIPCGVCSECAKKKSNEWKIRITEEIKHNKSQAYMVTLTFSDHELDKLTKSMGERGENAEEVSKVAVKRFRERWRKEFKKSIKHFLVSELGHRYTERLHLHGILICDQNLREGHINDNRQNRTTKSNGKRTGIMSTTCLLARKWTYGQVHIGEYCNESTVGYIVKYITKRDSDHPGFRPKILTSPGIGEKYINDQSKLKHKFKFDKTILTYKTNSGTEVALPKYYKTKLWTDREREVLWTIALDRETMWIGGTEVKKPLDIAIFREESWSQQQEVDKLLRFKQEQDMQSGTRKHEKKIYPAKFGSIV